MTMTKSTTYSHFRPAWQHVGGVEARTNDVHCKCGSRDIFSPASSGQQKHAKIGLMNSLSHSLSRFIRLSRQAKATMQ